MRNSSSAQTVEVANESAWAPPFTAPIGIIESIVTDSRLKSTSAGLKLDADRWGQSYEINTFRGSVNGWPFRWWIWATSLDISIFNQYLYRNRLRPLILLLYKEDSLSLGQRDQTSLLDVLNSLWLQEDWKQVTHNRNAFSNAVLMMSYWKCY